MQIGNNKEINIKTVYFGETAYYSANRLAEEYNIRIYNRKATGKFVFYFPKNKVKVTANSSFIMVDQNIIHMISPAIQAGQEIFVPVHSFNDVLKKYIYSDLTYTFVEDDHPLIFAVPGEKPEQEVAAAEPGEVYIKDIDFEEKKNGTVIILKTNGTFSSQDYSYFFKDNSYYYFTIYKCKGNEKRFSEQNPTSSIAYTRLISNQNSTQIIFKLNEDFNSSDVHFDPKTREFTISLFLPLNEEIKEKIANAKKTWIVDTIVLDPGHGGKDPGTPGRWNFMHEKDIVLDVVLRLGRLLEKETDLNVVYTRKTDTFVPLWKRTQIANQSNGKLFISFHVNAAGSKYARGFETYLLRPGRSRDAIKVAEAENAVIKMESQEDKEKYADYDNISNIIANMVHSTNMKDSENFAEILSNNFAQKVKQKNRGVKQAGFYVLVGASMPKVLVELGYNTNWSEAKQLNSRRYRQLIAETIFDSILEFKIKSDNSME
ncbi:MAG: N-acetylmuramoyl-L-alanine amidase [Fidelibacterota bacterium]